jgi:hypothetical protein
MLLYTESRPGATERSTQKPSNRRDAFARGFALDAHRKSSRALDEPDFQDRRPDQAPRQLGEVAAEVVGDIGEAALSHWLRQAALTEGEEHEIALQIAQKIAAMIGTPWSEVLSAEAAE